MTNPLANNSQRAKTLIYIFYAVIITDLLSVISTWLQILMIQKLDLANLNMEEIRANDSRQSIVFYINSLVLIATVVFFIMWFRRAYHNLQKAGQITEFTEGWAAGGWFVPFMNLVRPYKIMVEIWEKTQRAIPHIIGSRSSQIVGIWWAVYIVSGIVSNIAYRMAEGNIGMDGLVNASWVHIAADLVDIAAAIVAVMMIKQTSEMEQALYNNITTIQDEEGEHILGFVGDE